MSLKIEVKDVEGVAVLSCHGNVIFGDESAALRQKLRDVLGSKRKVVLDLSGVSYIDSGGLGMLVGAYSSARAAGSDIKLAGLGQRVRDLLQVTKLVTVFESFGNEAQAVAAFRSHA